MFFNLSSWVSIVPLLRSVEGSSPKQPPPEEIYDTSHTPEHLSWNTYNYCNAPHVSADHYVPPKPHSVVLKYATVFMRHHKVRLGLQVGSLLSLNSVLSCSYACSVPQTIYILTKMC